MQSYEKVQNEHVIPDEFYGDQSWPSNSRSRERREIRNSMFKDPRYLKRSNGTRFNLYDNLPNFEEIRDEDGDRKLIFSRQRWIDSWSSDVRVSESSDMYSVMNDAIDSISENMRAIKPDGSVMVTEDDVGEMGDDIELLELDGDQ
jgi:hypothetical protein